MSIAPIVADHTDNSNAGVGEDESNVMRKRREHVDASGRVVKIWIVVRTNDTLCA
jgi:hypothetical protein